MFGICSGCKSRPALTVCLRGRLCQKCARLCHPNYQHPVQFLGVRVGEQEDQNIASKSMVLLTRNNMGLVPKRVSRLRKHLQGTRNRSQDQNLSHSNPPNPLTLTPKLKRSPFQQPKKFMQETGTMTDSLPAQADNDTQALREKVHKQDKLLKKLKLELQRERKEKMQMRVEYQRNLQQIRQLRG